MMDWEKLLAEETLRPRSAAADDRCHFEKDWDRIVFSAPFRRLQDKTQVIPLPQQDFVHTRLTHSLETSAVGRSLGLRVANKLTSRHSNSKHSHLNQHFKKIPIILSAACLAHDIGNPPFGHSGESAISAFFSSPSNNFLLEGLDSDQILDFTNFEGNANGFKLLKDSPQLGLTCAVLATFTKYPVCAAFGFNKSDVRTKKYGLFTCDLPDYAAIASSLGIPAQTNGWYRHPLAFLTEAADDICYRIVDFEDGLKMNLITYQEFEESLLQVTSTERADQTREAMSKNDWSKNEKASYLRAVAIGSLISEVSDVFIDMEEEIRRGSLTKDLISMTSDRTRKALEIIQLKTKEKVYRCEKVLQIESAGFEVLGGLLAKFTDAVANLDRKTHVKDREKLMILLPTQFLHPLLRRTSMEETLEFWRSSVWKESWSSDPGVRYTTLLNICTFVAGMTDSYALTMFRRLKGIEMPI